MILPAAAEALRALAPWPAGPDGAPAPALLACSGGADSTFLAWAWRECPDLPPAVAVVVDHGHRAGSAADAASACARLAALGLAAEVAPATPPAPPDADEAALRAARFAALLAAARRHGAARVLTAHTADDLAETVLLRILRGTGLRGLAGIPARRALAPGVELLRPLLALRRDALRAALRARGIAWWEDPTNADPTANARAHLRLRVLPELAALATGDPVLAVLRLAGEARAWSASLDALVAAAPDWRALPPYLREQAVAAQLRALGETVSPARLRDLAGALSARGRAGIAAGRALTLQDGRLELGVES
jgi:tRNA(Ile)-lysidine synthase